MQKFGVIPGFDLNDLLREAEVLSKLQHPYIISLKDIFQTKDTLYIVTVRSMRHKPGGGPRCFTMLQSGGRGVLWRAMARCAVMCYGMLCGDVLWHAVR